MPFRDTSFIKSFLNKLLLTCKKKKKKEGGSLPAFFGLFSSPPSPCRLSFCVPLLSSLSDDLSPLPPIPSPPPSLSPSSEDGGRGGVVDGGLGLGGRWAHRLSEIVVSLVDSPLSFLSCLVSF